MNATRAFEVDIPCLYCAMEGQFFAKLDWLQPQLELADQSKANQGLKATARERQIKCNRIERADNQVCFGFARAKGYSNEL